VASIVAVGVALAGALTARAFLPAGMRVGAPVPSPPAVPVPVTD